MSKLRLVENERIRFGGRKELALIPFVKNLFDLGK